ncbi:divalent cation tolerance protein CutA [Streptomyces sp. NPDC001889]
MRGRALAEPTVHTPLPAQAAYGIYDALGPERARARVAGEHTYEVPEWIVLSVEGGSEEHLSWVVRESAPED